MTGASTKPKLQLVVEPGELKRIEGELGVKLKRVGTEEIKWRNPPNWEEKSIKAIVVEAPEELAYEIFEKYKVKVLRRQE